MLCSLQASQFYTAIYLRGVLLYLIKDIFNEKFKEFTGMATSEVQLSSSQSIFTEWKEKWGPGVRLPKTVYNHAFLN